MGEPDEQRTEEHELQPAAEPPDASWTPFYRAPPSPFAEATGAVTPPPPYGGPPPQAAPPSHDPALWLRAPSAPPAAPPPAPPPNWPTPATYAASEPENGRATAALVLGIVGLGLWFLMGFGFLFVFNLPCSIMAWIYGIQARRRIEAGQTTRGEGAARAGVILGVVGVILGVLGIAGWTLLFVLTL